MVLNQVSKGSIVRVDHELFWVSQKKEGRLPLEGSGNSLKPLDGRTECQVVLNASDLEADHLQRQSVRAFQYSNDRRVSGTRELAVMNGYDALRPGGHYAFLMGSYRKNEIFYPLASLCELIMPGKLREQIIKLQHNTRSERQTCSGAGTNFVPIAHEKMLIYEKTGVKFAFDFTIDNSLLLMALKDAAWKNIIRRAFMRNGNGASPRTLEQIYGVVEASDKARQNPDWQAKVRQVVREHQDVFQSVGRGVYALAA